MSCADTIQQIDIWKHSRNGIICMQRNRVRNLKWILLCMYVLLHVAFQWDKMYMIRVWVSFDSQQSLENGDALSHQPRDVSTLKIHIFWNNKVYCCGTVLNVNIFLFPFAFSTYFNAYNSLANRKYLRKSEKNVSRQAAEGYFQKSATKTYSFAWNMTIFALNSKCCIWKRYFLE